MREKAKHENVVLDELLSRGRYPC